MAHALCIHRLPDVDRASVPGFNIAVRTENRASLVNALGSLQIHALVIDIDEPDALDAIIAALEIKPKLSIVGVTSGADLKPVIAAQRAGCAHITTRPLDPNDLVIALRHAIDQSGESVATNDIYGLLGAIGGAGATTIACNLASELAAVGGGPAAILDLDLEFGGVARGFDLAPKFTIADLASVGAVDSILLERASVQAKSGAFVFARPPTIQEAHAIEETAVRNMLKVAGRTYRHLLLDLPRRLDSVVAAAIENCTKLILVLQLNVPSIDNAKRLMEALGAEGYPNDRIEVVVNRFRKNFHNLTVEMLERQLGQVPLGVVPNDYESVTRAVDVGETVSAKSPVRAAIRQIAEKLCGVQDAEKPTSWLSKVGLRR